jgi:DNA-binding MarR family transcriptional regulator
VQATAAKTQASAKSLGRDLFAVMTQLLRTTSQDLFRALGELDLSITQVKLLHALDDSDRERSVKDLSEAFALSLPAISRAIEVLHQRSYVERREDEHDRRMKRVTITPAGSALVKRFNETRLARLEELAATMTPAEQRRLAAALTPLLARPEIAQARPR